MYFSLGPHNQATGKVTIEKCDKKAFFYKIQKLYFQANHYFLFYVYIYFCLLLKGPGPKEKMHLPLNKWNIWEQH